MPNTRTQLLRHFPGHPSVWNSSSSLPISLRTLQIHLNKNMEETDLIQQNVGRCWNLRAESWFFTIKDEGLCRDVATRQT